MHAWLVELGEQYSIGYDILIHPPQRDTVVMQVRNGRLIFTLTDYMDRFRLPQILDKLGVNEDVFEKMMHAIAERFRAEGLNIGWDEWIQAERQKLAA